MTAEPAVSIPAEVEVSQLVESRYSEGRRPSAWKDRASGIDVIATSGGDVLKLQSNGQQSPPQPGWRIVLTGGDALAGYTWTLYGLSREK